MSEPVLWVSPLHSDSFAEYRDDDALTLVGAVPGKTALSGFWPKGGPQWDALGKTASGRPVLVEAKAHAGELLSGPSRARSPRAIELIGRALDATMGWLGAAPQTPWNGPYYQYVNRLAMLYFLDQLNEIPSYLVFVYFTGDSDMQGPASEVEWHGALKEMRASLGIATLPTNVIEVFFPVIELG